MRPLALLLLFASCCWGAPPVVTLPREVKGEPAAFIVVRAETEAVAVKFYAVDAGLNVFPAGLLSDAKATVVTSARPGRFRLLAYSGNADGPSDPVEVLVVVGDSPAPVPPGPQPPGPGPQPSGKRAALLIRESTNTTLGQTVNELRNGVHAEFLAKHGHKFYTLDPDDKDANGNPSPLVAPWIAKLDGTALPALIVIDPTTQTIVHKQTIPGSAKPADIISIIDQHD